MDEANKTGIKIENDINENILVDVQNIEKIKLVLDIDNDNIEDFTQIEYETSCPKISEDAPEAFFYDDSKDIIEVEFKGSRRAYYYKDDELHLTMNDYVIVEAEKGVDLGRVYLLGELVHIKRRAQVLRKDVLRKIISKATPEDIQKMNENREVEESAFLVCRKKIEAHALPMKLIDVEYQYDRNRVTFYFTSDKRIDFRELVKDLAAEYRTRIELRQIGVRDEAKMIGGISGCGRVLCCCTFLNDFKRITTQVAKTQMLNMNPVKLSGQCGRLKCCLMYEHDFYCEELKKFPVLDAQIKTPKGEGVIEKVDIFKNTVYIHYNHDDSWEMFELENFTKLYPKSINSGLQNNHNNHGNHNNHNNNNNNQNN
jgi:cell fate regulator YaaT (PSP1 superfamily)